VNVVYLHANVLFLCLSKSRAMLRAQQPPLKERILHSKSQSPSYVNLHTQNWPHYKSWSIDHLQQAYDAVTKRGLSVRRAAEVYRVPRQPSMTGFQERCSLERGVVLQLT